MVMMLLRNLLLVMSFSLAAGCASILAPSIKTEPAALRPGNYELDRNHAALLFKVGHLGFSDYIGRFERFDVSLEFDEDKPQASTVEAVIDMTSLDVANDAFAETLMGGRWFDADQFPETVFRSTGIEITGENSGLVTGDLTMHGVTNPVTLEVVFNGGGFDRLRGAYVIGLSAQSTLSRSAFGVDRFGPLVSDEIEIEIEAEFKKR